MTSNVCYKIMLDICAKNSQQGYLSPDDFYTYINAAQIQYLDYLVGEYQKYVAGRPIAPVEVGNKEKLRQSIAPLIYGAILTPNTTTGIAPFPSDYEMVDAMWSLYGSSGNGFYNIRFVSQQRLSSFWQSAIDPIVTDPIYTLKWEGIQFYPENIGFAKLSYVRKPPSIVWGNVLNSNGEPVWNPATSQDPIWSEIDMMNIIARALRMYGVQVDSSVVSQFANEIKIGGQ